ncbi:MAG: cytochrome C oxidase subunit IV family protein [Gammaproteobacteria bacterium]
MNGKAIGGLRPCTWIWLALIALTLLTYAAGAAGLGGTAIALTVLGLGLLKALLVADHFMGLRRVSGFWRPVIGVYLLVLGVGIGLAWKL